jgi:RNA polymerase-binding transcription factor DksA
LEELQKTEDQLLKNEEQIKKEVKKSVHDFEQKIKKAMSADRDKRWYLSDRVQRARNEAISGRYREHHAEIQAILDSLRRASDL